MDVWEKIRNDYPKYDLKPMANDIDLIGELIFINYLKPKTCWEIGTGKGDWALFMNMYINETAEWNLTENFEWATTTNNAKLSYIPNDWPKTAQDIHNHIDKISKSTNKKFKYNLYTQDISQLWHKINKPVDLWRIDCDLENDEIAVEKMLDLSSDNVIFFVDDIESNRCLNRLCTMMDQVRKENLDLVYMGKGEAAWVKPKSMNLNLIYDIFIENKKYFNKIKLMTDKIYFGKQKEYIVVE
jgi:hypothetical protein